MKKLMIMICVALISLLPVTAQEGQTVVVPDVVDLTVAQAGAVLNQAGLSLGEEIVETPPSAEFNPTIVVRQSVAPGTETSHGDAVDVTVYRQAQTNMLLLYDDNDITMVNQTGAAIDSRDVLFVSSNTRFHGGRWARIIQPGDCVQLWSVGRSSGKGLDQCGEVNPWMTTNDPAEYFWNTQNQDATFKVMHKGLPAGECPKSTVAGLMVSCEFYWPLDTTNDGYTPYIYLAYTTERMQIWNNSEDEWMPVGGIQLIGEDGTRGALTADPSIFDNSESIIADVERLAPNQCLYYPGMNMADSDPIQECDEIARYTFTIDNPIFTQNFDVLSNSIAAPAKCPAATPGRLTVCIVPR